MYGQKSDGAQQKAVIDFLCDARAEERRKRDLSSLVARDDDEEDHSATGEVADDGHGGKVKYISYEQVGDNHKVLTM